MPFDELNDELNQGPVVPDGLADMSETHQLARQVVQVLRSADFDNPAVGHDEVMMHTENLVFDDDGSVDHDRVAGYLVIINRFLAEIVWSWDAETRDRYFDHLAETVDWWSSMAPSPWFDPDPSPFDTGGD